jgi:hypothetical protein
LKVLLCSLGLCFVSSGCPCGPGYFCESGKCRACPLHAVSLRGSLILEDCYCPAGYSGAADGSCFKCPVGKFKEFDGHGGCRSCTAGSISQAGSTHKKDCKKENAAKSHRDLNEIHIQTVDAGFKQEHPNTKGVEPNSGDHVRQRSAGGLPSVCSPGTYQEPYALVAGNETILLNLDTNTASKVGPISHPQAFRFLPNGKDLVAIQSNGDYRGGYVYGIDLSMLRITTIAGGTAWSLDGAADGYGTYAQFDGPTDLSVSKDGTFVLISDNTGYDRVTRCRIRQINLTTNLVSTIAGGRCGFQDGTGTYARFGYIDSVSLSPNGEFALTSAGGWIRRLDLKTFQVTTVPPGFNNGVNNVRILPNGTFAMYSSYRYEVGLISLSGGFFSFLAGGGFGFADGVGSNARFGYISQLTVSPSGTYALIVDSRIRRVDIMTRAVSTIATGLSYVSWLDLSGCSFCKPGTYSVYFGAGSCTPCGGGTYQSQQGSSSRHQLLWSALAQA